MHDDQAEGMPGWRVDGFGIRRMKDAEGSGCRATEGSKVSVYPVSGEGT